MDSFYGGKPGVSFVLKGRFNYISPEEDTYQAALNSLIEAGKSAEDAIAELAPATMTECFKDVNYKDIWYNEFCIIDTLNKSDKDNGKVFRRTLKNPSDEKLIGGVAEYIGQIVGPAGIAPLFEIGSVDSTAAQWEATEVKSTDFIEYYDEDGVKRNKKTEDSTLKTFITGAEGAIKLVPGRTFDTTGYIDEIQYNWYQFIEGGMEDGDPAKIFVGFDIPAYNADFIAGQALNYTEAPQIAEIDETKDAHFFNRYEINIPRGITGGYFKDFQRITKTSDLNVYGTDVILYKPGNDNYIKNNDAAPISGLNGKDIYIVYFYWYDAQGDNHKLDYPIYAGTVKDIRNISNIENDGSFTVNYTDNSFQTYDKALSWITNVNIDEDSNLSFTANNDNLQQHLPQPFNLRTIKNISLIGDIHGTDYEESPDKDANRKILIEYSDGTSAYIGDEINYIQKLYYAQPGNPEGLPAYHLYILFNAVSHRYNPDIPGQDDISEWVDIYHNGLYWKDLGYMRQVDQGVLLQTRVVPSEDGEYEGAVQTEEDAVEYLNWKYPEGLSNENAGKLVGVKFDTGDVYLMAYDYDNETWFSIGSLQGATLDAIVDGVFPQERGSATTVWFSWNEAKPEVTPMTTPWTYQQDTTVDPGDSIRLKFLTNEQGADMIDDIWPFINNVGD